VPRQRMAAAAVRKKEIYIIGGVTITGSIHSTCEKLDLTRTNGLIILTHTNQEPMLVQECLMIDIYTFLAYLHKITQIQIFANYAEQCFNS